MFKLEVRIRLMFIIPDNPPAIIKPASTNYIQACCLKTLQNCEAKNVWSAFEEITKIYRESGHCEQISAYIQTRLIKDGFLLDKKPDGTLCATRGLNKDKNNAIILQSHMDIVAVSADGNTKKPINFILKDNFLYADNRTLGADNGIGVAVMLALAEDESFKDTPLELIFTTDEETGMYGAKSLDKEDFYGKYLINLDSEKYGEIVTGCAGIVKFQVKEALPVCQLKDYAGFKQITLTLSGARGGHSAEMQTDYLNPILVLLQELSNIKDLKLVKLTGGERENSIPRDAQAVFLVPVNEADKITAALKSHLIKLREKNLKQNPDFSFSILQNQPPQNTTYVNLEIQEKLFKTLKDIPVGLFNAQSNGKKTSQNLGVIKIEDSQLYIEIMGRSSYTKDIESLSNRTSQALSKLFGKDIKAKETSAIWNSKTNSELEKTALTTFIEIPECKTPEIKVEHGGLEPAIFIETKPELDIISIGPTIQEPHSIHERIQTDTVGPFYQWLSKIIKKLACEN